MSDVSALGTPRKRRRFILEDSRGAPVFTDRPEPPYGVVVTDMIWCCFTFDRNLVLPYMPPGLTPVPENIGFVGIYKNAMGWGIAPSVAGFVGISIDEYDSPDTSEALWVPTWYVTPPFDQLLSRHYGTVVGADCRLWRDNGLLHGSISVGGLDFVRATVRPSGPETGGMASLDRFVVNRPSGELLSFVVPITGTMRDAEIVSIEITEHAPPVMQATRPVDLKWGSEVPFMPATMGMPEPLIESAQGTISEQAARKSLLSLFDSYGRAACVVRTNSEVVHMNKAAADLIGPELARMGALKLAFATEQDRLLEALEDAATSRGANSVPTHFALSLSDGTGPVIAQVAPIDPLIAGPDTALVLLTDPAEPICPARYETLELLGLTPAEARTAVLVGGGLAPREAAGRLGITESTIRSTLKIVYDKLAIKRQSELVQIVGRLSV